MARAAILVRNLSWPVVCAASQFLIQIRALGSAHGWAKLHPNSHFQSNSKGGNWWPGGLALQWPHPRILAPFARIASHEAARSRLRTAPWAVVAARRRCSVSCFPTPPVVVLPWRHDIAQMPSRCDEIPFLPPPNGPTRKLPLLVRPLRRRKPPSPAPRRKRDSTPSIFRPCGKARVVDMGGWNPASCPPRMVQVDVVVMTTTGFVDEDHGCGRYKWKAQDRKRGLGRCRVGDARSNKGSMGNPSQSYDV